MKLVLVRHGESVGNYENRLQGHTDYELTELGQRQAVIVAERLAEIGTTALYTSPLLRAGGTAKAIGARLSLEPRVLPAVSEYHFGELAGATYREIRERFAANPSTANQQPTERIYPGEEGRDVFFKRVTEALWQIIDEHDGETVAVVSHGGPIALFCQTILGLPYKRPMPFAIDNCSLNVIEAVSGDRTHRAVLTSLNDVCHLASLQEQAPAG